MSWSTAKEGNGTTALGAGSTAIVGANQARTGIIITNIGPGVTNLAFQEGVPGGEGPAPTAAATTGIQLAVGGSLSLLGDSCFTGAIAAFGTAASVVGWVEF